MTFRDHFSGHASDYATYRPSYPDALYDWLAAQAPQAPVWDCATGNGQAAVALAERFPLVDATDASAQQVEAAEPHPRVRYRVANAIDSGLPAHSVGLVTVAQALHWFDFAAFFAECERVLVPGGLVVAWTYELFEVTPPIDAVVRRLYARVDAAWPPERRHIEAGYATIPWPWPKLEVPAFEMTATWSLEQTLGYLGTWSGVRRFSEQTGSDAVAEISADLASAWKGAGPREIRWPMPVLASRIG